MAFHGNQFTLLGDDADDVENLISRFTVEDPSSVVEKRKGNSKQPLASSSQLEVEVPPYAVDKRKGSTKPLASSCSSPHLTAEERNGKKPSSNPQRFFDHEKGRRHGLERHMGNGLERNNRVNGVQRQNNRVGGSSFKRNYGYMPHDSSENYEEECKGYQKKEESTNGEVWQVVRRSNVGKQKFSTGYPPRRGPAVSLLRILFGQIPSYIPLRGNEVKNNVGGRARNNGWRREFKGDPSEVRAFKDKLLQERRQQDGFSGNVNKDENEYRTRSRDSGGNNIRDNRGFNRGYEGSNQRYGLHGEDNGKKSGTDSTGDQVNAAGSKGDDAAVARAASKESKPKNSKHDQTMTLKVYEKQLQEKRKILESLKSQAEFRVATLDKDFESMHTIEKKNEETIFVKLNSESDKLKKKVTMDENNNFNAHKPLAINLKPAQITYTRRSGGGRYAESEKSSNGGCSGGRQGTGNNHGGSGSVEKKTEARTPSFEELFPALALNGSTKE